LLDSLLKRYKSGYFCINNSSVWVKMSVVAALSEIKKFLQIKSRADVSTRILKLHKLSSALLLTCSILTTFRQHFGSNIHCMLGGGSIPLPMYESYCFMAGTYTLPKLISNSSSLVPRFSGDITTTYHGVSTGIGGGVEDGTVFHNYYQWVPLLLVIQAAMFYLPWGVWKAVEGGRVAKLLAKVSQDPLTETPVCDQVATLGDFILTNGGWFDSSAIKLLVSQVCCLLLTLVQMFAMDIVLGNEFFNLGADFLNLELLINNLNKVFPIVVKCSMVYIGPSGDPVNNSGMCTLPINIINEKLYFILWAWCMVLTAVSLFTLFFQFLYLLLPTLRFVQLQRFAPTTPHQYVKFVARRASYGDMILLQMIAENVDTSQFSALVDYISETRSLPYLQNSYVTNEKGFRKEL